MILRGELNKPEKTPSEQARIGQTGTVQNKICTLEQSRMVELEQSKKQYHNWNSPEFVLEQART